MTRKYKMFVCLFFHFMQSFFLACDVSTRTGSFYMFYLLGY